MSTSGPVCRIAPQPFDPLLPYDQDIFELQWQRELGDPLLLFEFPHATIDPPIATAPALPTIARTDEDREYNRSTGGVPLARQTHFVMIGDNTAAGTSVERHSIMGCTVYDDDEPYLFVWDWRAGVMHGPLFPPNPVKMIQGPVFIDPFIYFVALESSDLKARLYRSNANLTKPSDPEVLGADEVGSATNAIPATRSVEHMIASGNFVGILISPAGASGSYAAGWSWNRTTPGAANELSTFTNLFSYNNNQIRNHPGSKLLTPDSFYNPSFAPFRNVIVNTTTYERETLQLVGDWGTDTIGSVSGEKSFTVFNNETDVLYSYSSTLPSGFTFGIRTWRTGVVIEADALFIQDAALTAGYQVAQLFPFEGFL